MYIVEAVKSMTGVDVKPYSGLMSKQPPLAGDKAPLRIGPSIRKLLCHRVAPVSAQSKEAQRQS